MQKIRRHTKKALIAIAGGLVVLIGLVAIPYPGPGWLILLAGFAILATEFTWAQHILDSLRRRYEYWMQWLKQQHSAVRLTVLAVTGLVVVVTIWLFNGYGLIDNWFHLGLDWVHSPFIK